HNRGANAIVGMRFDTTEIGDGLTEICAYGTAVRAVHGLHRSQR
ncbi:heavy metal-binding domain-containing protein, partial [Mycobacterium sp. Lab-001]